MQKVYDEEFKINMVQLILKNKMSVTAASKDLGIGKSTLHRWLGLYKTRVSSYSSLKSSIETSEGSQDVKRLKRENEILRQERDILKKALSIFSQPTKGSFPL
jgi:transposase